MQTDIKTFRIVNAGEMNWFEADQVTLSEIKTRYLLYASDFLYFRKGEDWLKHLIACLEAVGNGTDQILQLASAYGTDALQFTQIHIDALNKLNFVDFFDWYLRIVGIVELSKKARRFIERRVWPHFVKRVNEKRPLVRDFRILCKSSVENIQYLPQWRVMGTQVRFYKDDADAGSHRFYIYEKGYAVFWRQGQRDKTRFYGFEGTNQDIVQRLKIIFEVEWKKAVTPKITRTTK